MKLSTESRDNMIDRIVLSSISQTLPQFVKKIFMKRYLVKLDQGTTYSVLNLVVSKQKNFSTKVFDRFSISEFSSKAVLFEIK